MPQVHVDVVVPLTPAADDVEVSPGVPASVAGTLTTPTGDVGSATVGPGTAREFFPWRLDLSGLTGHLATAAITKVAFVADVDDVSPEELTAAYSELAVYGVTDDEILNPSTVNAGPGCTAHDSRAVYRDTDGELSGSLDFAGLPVDGQILGLLLRHETGTGSTVGPTTIGTVTLTLTVTTPDNQGQQILAWGPAGTTGPGVTSPLFAASDSRWRNDDSVGVLRRVVQFAGPPRAPMTARLGLPDCASVSLPTLNGGGPMALNYSGSLRPVVVVETRTACSSFSLDADWERQALDQHSRIFPRVVELLVFNSDWQITDADYNSTANIQADATPVETYGVVCPTGVDWGTRYAWAFSALQSFSNGFVMSGDAGVFHVAYGQSVVVQHAGVTNPPVAGSLPTVGPGQVPLVSSFGYTLGGSPSANPVVFWTQTPQIRTGPVQVVGPGGANVEQSGWNTNDTEVVVRQAVVWELPAIVWSATVDLS